MKEYLKRLLSVALALVLTMSLVLPAAAVEGETTEIEAVPVSTPEELAVQLTSDNEHISVILENNIDIPISSLGTQTAGSGQYKLGGESTKTITIDLNEKKLNITTSYWSILGAKNANAVFTIKNGIMTSSQTSGTWNSYDLGFDDCQFIFDGVTFEKAIFLDSNATLRTVTVNETHDYYAIWIPANGQTVSIDGLTVISGRGIKVDRQYVANPPKVTLEVSNATFTTTKKAAIMVMTPGGTDITLSNIDISNVAADSTNAVWVDEDGVADFGHVTVTGGTLVPEGGETAYIASVVDVNGQVIGYYNSLVDAIAAGNGRTIKLLDDIVLTDTLTIPADVTATLDLNGHTISQTKAQTGAYSMIDNKGSLTIIDSGEGGAITYTDSGNGGEYVSNTIANSGTLLVSGGTISNKSSATVATNGYPHAIDTRGILTVNGGVITCDEYSAIRIWCNTTPTSTVNIQPGATINGAIDFHNVDSKANLGALNITGGVFNTTKNANVLRVLNFGTDLSGMKATISDGTFNGGIKIINYDGSNKAAVISDVLTVTGGSFVEVPDCVAEGYVSDVKVGEYFIVHKHNSDKILPEVGATCTTTGLTAGAKCSVCDKITVEQTMTSVKPHDWSTDFQPGEDTHWNYCKNEGCTVKTNEAVHSWGKNHMDEAHIVADANNNACAVAYHISCDVCAKSHATDIFWVKQENPVHVYDEGVVTKEATCTETGIMTYTCQNAGCGHTKTETIAKKAHTEVDIPAVAPTCTASGLTVGKKCSVCGTVTKEPETISMKPHTEVEIPAKAATCTEPGLTAGKKCSVCGEILTAQTETPATGHDWGYRFGVTPEGNKHWMWCRNFCGADPKEMGDHVYTHSDDLSKYQVMHETECGTIVYRLPECEVCGFDGPVTAAQKTVYKEDGEHVFDEGKVLKASTCTEAGEIVYTCTVELCGFEKTEKLPLAAHTLKKVEGKEATYSAAGVKEHYICSACDALFADAEGKTAITDVVIPQLIKVEGTTAKVETGAVDSALTEAVEKAEESGAKVEVIVEVEKAVDTEASTDPSAPADTVKPEDVEKVVEVQLPVASIDKVVEAEANLTVVLPNATVTVDTEALKAVSDQAAGEAVTLVVEEVKTESLTVAQQKTVEKYDVAVTITAELICQTTGEKIWTEKANEAVESGNITVKLPFTPAENTKGSDYVVLYIADDGSVTEIETEFVDGHLVFALEHFSDYVVVNTAAKAYPDSPATGDTARVALLVALVVVSLAGLAVCVILARKNRYIPKH